MKEKTAIRIELERLIPRIAMMNIPVIGLVENMSYFECPNCKERHYIYGESEIQAIAERYDIDTVLQLPLNREYASACDKGKAYEMDAKMMVKMKNGTFTLAANTPLIRPSTSARRHWMEKRTMKEPRMVTVEIKISSGP